jgi:hypothetical protein
MLLNSLYFRLKPLIPRSVQLGIRRWFVLRKRQQVENVWPIMPGSERRPEGWPGWPDGKRFAFVLTHDVEGQQGVENCRQLAELEQKFGFRSSVNFVPEGNYTVPAALRFWLTDRGFEVGVHDLHHDGQLYSSREEFSRKAQRINEVLKEWGAVGFRSGYMLRNLEWIKELDIAYDASTFDTDPFEPQPDGVETIFPFWGHWSGKRQGYVELPYTMVQDSTLFLILREKTIELWKKKLDWIAEHQGMVLLNVHPDYIDFVDANGSSQQYPVAHYRELLEYVRDRYAGRFWHALPRDVAAYCARFKPEHPCPAGAGHSVPNSSTSNYPGWLGWASLFEAVASQ